MKKKTRKKHEK